MVKDLKEKYRPDQVEGYVAPQVSLSQALMADPHDEVLAK